MIRSVVFSCILLFFISCEEQITETVPLNIDYSYYPLVIGMWFEYEVTFINIDKETAVFDTTSYLLKEVFSDRIIDANGDSVVRIVRYIKNSLSEQWDEKDVWQTSINGREALKTEENIKFIKIIFPVREGLSWNGNAYNQLDTLNEYRYIITSIDSSEIINSIKFDSVLTVTQKDKESIIDKVYFIEKYAKHVGLVEKQQIDIYSTDVDGTIPIEDRVTKGTMYYQKIIAYGKD